MSYGMKLTTIGATKLLAAATDESAISFAKIVWGNANGVAYEPTGTEVELVNQLHETNVISVGVEPETPNVYRVAGELTSAPSEFTLLEVGIVDDDGDLIAIGNHPAQFVPGPASAFTLNYNPNWLIVISPDLAVAVTLAPPGEFATEEWVTANFQPKGTYVKTVTGSGGVKVEGSATDRDARLDEAWLDSRYKKVDATEPGVQSVRAGTGITVTGNAANPVVNFNAQWGDARYRGANEPFPLPSHVHPNATPSAPGFMSAADKTKLDGMSSDGGGGAAVGGGLFVKVSEAIITSPTPTVDLLNVTGYKQYWVKATGLRVTPALGYGERADLYMQLGNNSTLYASNGNYFDTSKPHAQIFPELTTRPSLATGGGITGSNDPAFYRGVFAMLLRHLNSATKKTRTNVQADEFAAMMIQIDEDANLPDGQLVEREIRTAATAENRIRYLLAPGKQFIAGRISVYGIN